MSIKIDQAFFATIMSSSLQTDLVFEDGVYSQWNGVSYVNKTGGYNRIADRPFIELMVFPSSVTPLSLAHTNEASGVYQCVVNYPINSGAFSAKAKAEEILSLLSAGSVLTYLGQTVHISSNSRSNGRDVDNFFQIVVRANYRAFITRA